ncbi:MAG: Ig-like domain-containing protein [Sporichthyaceae bacterium]
MCESTSRRLLSPFRGVALGATLVLVLGAACGGGQSGLAVVGAPLTPPAAPRVPMSISVFPTSNDAEVPPDSPVTVNVAGGALDTVVVRDEAGDKVHGRYLPDRTGWSAAQRLRSGQRYTVTVLGRSHAGIATSATSRFRTRSVDAEHVLSPTRISPLNGSVVGVAHPVVVGFNRPVSDRAAVLADLHLSSSPAVSGGWYWIDERTVHFRPKRFWPAGTHVRLHTTLDGLAAGDGVWGGGDRVVTFEIGRKQVIRVDVPRHRMRVIRNNELLRTLPVSTGKPGWETRNGIKVLMEKVAGKTWTNEAIDAPEDYTLRSKYAMRLTNSGEFIHDAPWNLGNIGRAAASHGCVGTAPADMAWLFRRSLVGDPVIVSGSPRPYTELWNRYQDWNVPWATWQDGNLDLRNG